MGRFEARATVDWEGFGGSVESASGMLATATAAQVVLLESTTVLPGHVIRPRPKVGTHLAHGARVGLTISTGPRLRGRIAPLPGA